MQKINYLKSGHELEFYQRLVNKNSFFVFVCLISVYIIFHDYLKFNQII